MSCQVCLIGIGNEYRGDDGAGRMVARLLKEKGLLGVCVRECEGDAAALMEAWKGASQVFLIDAVASGAAPGTIHRLDALARGMPSSFSFHSTHAFGLSEAIELARALDQLPQRMLIFGIEGADFALGSGFSPRVEAALPEVAERLADEVRALLSREQSR